MKLEHRILPDGRVSIRPASGTWRFERIRPYTGKLWSGRRYSKQPAYVVYTQDDIIHMWRKATKP